MRPTSTIFPIFLVIFGFISVLTLRSIDITYGTNQLLFYLVGAAAFIGVSRVNFFWLEKTRWIWYIGVLLLLLLTYVVGTTTQGSLRWISFGAYRLQPSELLRPALMLLLAVEAGRRPVNNWKNIFRYAFLAAAPLILVLIQPDLGTFLVLSTGAIAIYLLSGARKQHLFILGSLAIALSMLAWTMLLQPYQQQRITSFLNPSSDPLGAGYNAQQALIAVGAGGWLGTGFGDGPQSHLRFLPERQNDFIFATYAEEAGFVGSVLLIFIYAGLFGWIAYLMSFLVKKQQVALTGGLLTMLMVQTFINIGMNIGIAPITGVTLPFMSLGGSSLLSSAISLGIIESIRRSNIKPSVI